MNNFIKMTTRELDNINKEREMKVYKADEMLQQACCNLTLVENRLILYTISKIKPTDTDFMEYNFNLKDFYNICGVKTNESYTKTKKILKNLANKSWWITTNNGTETLIRWFNVLEIKKNTGIVTIKFHEKMFPYLLLLQKKEEFYTGYKLKYVLPMKSIYSQRLYEILKSYQKNNLAWWFKIDELKKILNCENYTRYPDFRRRVIEIAINEINKYTDIKISYNTEKQGNKVTIITFYMIEKTTKEQIETNEKILTELDGNIHFWDINYVNK